MENIFAITAVPLLSYALTKLWHQYGKKIVTSTKSTGVTMGLSILGLGTVCAAVGTGLFFPFAQDLGIGLYPGYEKSIAFIKSLPNTGPIFNNFDAGSFLIYSLYPDRKVFIDNRAEAYPADFLQNEYITPQENNEAWKRIDAKYNFSTIIFYRHDLTNWGQQFLITRVQDTTWVPIYVDNYLIVFVKDIPANQELITKYRLPASMFTVTKN